MVEEGEGKETRLVLCLLLDGEPAEGEGVACCFAQSDGSPSARISGTDLYGSQFVFFMGTLVRHHQSSGKILLYIYCSHLECRSRVF